MQNFRGVNKIQSSDCFVIGDKIENLFNVCQWDDAIGTTIQFEQGNHWEHVNGGLANSTDSQWDNALLQSDTQ